MGGAESARAMAGAAAKRKPGRDLTFEYLESVIYLQQLEGAAGAPALLFGLPAHSRRSKAAGQAAAAARSCSAACAMQRESPVVYVSLVLAGSPHHCCPLERWETKRCNQAIKQWRMQGMSLGSFA